MLIRWTTISVATLAAGLSLVFTSSAGALTAQECSAKYQAAKTAGTLGGQTWNQFRRTQCGATAAAAPAPTTPAATPAAAPAAPAAGALTAQECSAKYQAAKTAGTLGGQTWNQFRRTQCGAAAAAAPAPTTPAATPAAAPAAPAAPQAVGNAVFPTAVSPKYSSESPGKARMHTCLDQYKANQATNANGGLKWTQKGGGYYSECTKHLKG
jgi:hypothetical protein